MNDPTRVLLSLDLPPRQDGGIATLVDALASGLAAIGEPLVVYARGRGEDCSAWDERRPYRVVRMRGHSWIRHSSRNLTPYIFDIYSKYRPAILYVATWQLGGFPARLAQRLGMRVVLLVHGRDVTEAEELREPMRRADRVVTTTGWMREQLVARGLAEERIAVVPPAVLPAPDDAPAGALRQRLALGDGPVVLSVGRLVPRKGQDALIRAMASLGTRYPDARLLLVGKGEDHGRLQALIAELGVEQRVHLTGFLSPEELEQAYGLARLFAMPCREEAGGDTEGFGLVFLEAGARGLAVIGGRTAGVVEAVEHGRTGLLVTPGDHDELVAAMDTLLGDPGAASAMGVAGRERVETRFSPTAYARRFLEVEP